MPGAARPSPRIETGPVYRGDPKANQYRSRWRRSTLRTSTGSFPRGILHAETPRQRSTMHVNPIVVNGRIYITTPSLKAVALDAATGREIWSFDPSKIQRARSRDQAAQSRRHVLEGREEANGSFTSSKIGSTRWTRKQAG